MLKTRNSIVYTIAFFVLSLLFIVGIAYSGAFALLWALIGILGLLYYFAIKQIVADANNGSVLCDCRFYVFTAIFAYSILPPIYGVLTFVTNHGVKMMSTHFALTYTSHELGLTIIMSILFFVGINIGLFFKIHSKYRLIVYKDVISENGISNKRMLLFWFVICIISTFFFLIPFIKGGFAAIIAGGTIMDVETNHDASFMWKIVDIFFSPEIMTVSTVAILYYSYKLDVNKRTKNTIFFSIVIVECLLAYLTTRRARAIAIILCALIIYIQWYKKEKGKLPIRRIIVVGAIFAFFYLLEVIMGLANTGDSQATLLSLFDGVPAYDSLLLATRNNTDLSMISNIIYGLFRPIPVLGKYIIRFLGFNNDVAPMYQWMADRYSIYQFGAGLAYTPQLEAFITGSYIGCLLYGILYGYIFGKRRDNLPNLFVAAMAFSVARGNLQILLSLIWPFGIIGLCFYDQFLFRRINLFAKTRSK